MEKMEKMVEEIKQNHKTIRFCLNVATANVIVCIFNVLGTIATLTKLVGRFDLPAIIGIDIIVWAVAMGVILYGDKRRSHAK